jgi:AraC-like DNA-binding protein
MLYVHKRPPPPLDAFVETIWLCRNEPRSRVLERVLPSAASQLIVNLAEDATRLYQDTASVLACQVFSGTVLSGIGTRYQIIDTDEQAHVAGVVFHPGGTLAFVGAPASELSNADVEAENLWGRGVANRIRERLLAATNPTEALREMEVCLLEIWRERVCHPAVAFALDTFRASPTVSRVQDITDAISLSPKRFIEKFEAQVGLTPKRYCRLLRFQQAVAKAHRATPLDWAELALDCGYFDQAHFIHEFREFSGITPSVYAARTTDFHNHVTFLQSPGNALA